MIVTHRWLAIFLLLIAAMTPSLGLATVQDSTCTYDRCALRLQHRFWSLRLVAGANATPVARLGMFATRIEPLSRAGDPVKVHYEAFRRNRNRAGAFTLIGVATIVASLVVYDANTNHNQGVAVGLALAALPFAIVGGVSDVKARDHLEQAMWLYNRSLPRGP